MEEGALFSPARGSSRGLILSCWLVGLKTHQEIKGDVFVIQRCRSCVHFNLSRLGLKGAPLSFHNLLFQPSSLVFHLAFKYIYNSICALSTIVIYLSLKFSYGLDLYWPNYIFCYFICFLHKFYPNAFRSWCIAMERCARVLEEANCIMPMNVKLWLGRWDSTAARSTPCWASFFFFFFCSHPQKILNSKSP